MTDREQAPLDHSENEDAKTERRPLTRVTRKVSRKTKPMDSSKEHFEQRQPMVSGPVEEMQRLRGHGAATAAELREFLGQLKGRTPQEVMGIVAQSSLVQGITTATFACGVLLAVFTVVPYAIYGSPKDQQPETVAVAVQPSNEQSNSAETPEDSSTTTDESAKPDLAKAADAMGIGETTEADPDKNPLDTKLDSLLDGIE